MGALEWLVLLGGLGLGLGWIVRNLTRGQDNPKNARTQRTSPAAAPLDVPAQATAAAEEPEDDEPDDEDEAEAKAAKLAAQKGPAAVAESFARLEADFREEDDFADLLPPLVRELRAPGAEAFAEELIRAYAEFRPGICITLNEVAGEVGKPLLEPLLARATEANAKEVGKALGSILSDADDVAGLEDLGLRQTVVAIGARPERADLLQEVLDAAVDELLPSEQMALLRHERTCVRAAAARCVTGLNDRAIAELAREQDPRIRIALLRNGALWRGKSALVEPFFRDPSPAVRIEACLRAGWEFDGEAERLTEDRDRAVALAARSCLEEEGMLARIDEALASGDPALRRAACRAAGSLPEADALKAFSALQLDGSPAELRAFLEEYAPEDLESLRHLARYARSDPPPEVVEPLVLALSYNDDVAGGAELPLQLLDRALPPRVRRMGFDAMASTKAGRARRLEALLVPDEPQLADFLWALRWATSDVEEEEQKLYRRLRSSTSAMLKAFAEQAD